MRGTAQPLLPLEARLLVAAVGRPEAAGVVAELAEQDPDWQRSIALASAEKLLPVFWEGIAGLPRVDDQPELQALRRMAAVADFQLVGFARGLEQTVRVLADEGIPVMLLKGAALAHTVFDSFAERPMGDLDLLLPADRVQEGWDALHEAGWEPEFGEAKQFWEDLQHLRPLVNPARLPVAIEIHRTIVRPGPFDIDYERLWRSSRLLRIGGVEARVPSPHHQILHLSVHLAWQNMLSRLVVRTSRDVARVIDRDPPEWDALEEVALESRAGSCVYWTLRLGRSLGVTPVPETTLETLRPALPRTVLDALERIYLSTALGDGYPSVRLGRLFWKVGIRPGRSGHGPRRPWHDGARWRTLMTDDDPATLGARLRHHLAHLSEWTRVVKAGLVPKDPL